jgi:hypothetical protein
MMPRFRKLDAAESAALSSPPLGPRAQVAREYDAYLADVAIGHYVRADLAVGDVRSQVCSRLHAAARRRGLALRFRPGHGPLIFCVEALPVVGATRVAAVAALSERVPTQRGRPPCRQRQERRPAGRYDDVLPRWMRDGQPAGRRDEGKRRGQ